MFCLCAVAYSGTMLDEDAWWGVAQFQGTSADHMVEGQRLFVGLGNLDTKMFLETFDIARFREKFATDNGCHGNPFLNATELKHGDTEWQCNLALSEKMLPFGFCAVPKM